MWPFKRRKPEPAPEAAAPAPTRPAPAADPGAAAAQLERARAADASGDPDGATHHARLALAIHQRAGTAGAELAEAFWLLTRAYDGLGALAYCQRVLGHARQRDVPADWVARYDAELTRLEQALTDFTRLDRNADWEAFLSTSLDGERFEQLCRDEGFPRMAERVAFLRRQFDGHSTFNATDLEEVFLVE